MDRPASAAGSGTAGPPLGAGPTEPLLVPPLEPHARRTKGARAKQTLGVTERRIDLMGTELAAARTLTQLVHVTRDFLGTYPSSPLMADRLAHTGSPA